jgi:cytochrome c oxidase subunit 1
MILPSMGVISELVTCFSRKKIFGYGFVAGSSVAIAVLGFLVWGHHMFVSGQSVYAGMVFSVLSFLVAIPSAIKVFNWTATLYKGSIVYQTPMLYAFGSSACSPSALDRTVLATLAVDVHCDTHFVSCALPPSWWAAPSWATWAASTSGGPKSAGVCIRRAGRGCRC